MTPGRPLKKPTPRPAHGENPQPQSVGQIQLTRDGQTLLLSVEQSADTVAFLNRELADLTLIKQETRHSLKTARQTGRMSSKTLLIYQMPASHENTMALMALGRQIKSGGTKQLRLTNEQTRTHFHSHQAIAKQSAAHQRDLAAREAPVLPVAHRQAGPTTAPDTQSVLPVGVTPAVHRQQARAGRPVTGSTTAPQDGYNIRCITGRSAANAEQVTALKIQAPRDPNEIDRLANGYRNEGLYDLIMAQPGASYVKSRKGRGNVRPRAGYFRVPISETTAALIKRLGAQYGLTLEPTVPTLNQPVTQAIGDRLNHLKRTYELSSMDQLPESATATLVAPDGLNYLPYQRAGIAYALKMGNALIADEPGLGKTIQAVGVSNALPNARRILVIVPASLKINWQREWQKWDAKSMRVDRVRDGKPESWPAQDGNAQVVVINFDLTDQHYDKLTEQPWDLLVIDEAHALKNEDAQRTQRILGHGTGTKRIPGIPATRKLFLTGTPILNRPAELWSLAHALDPDFFSDKRQFEKRYCNAHQTDFGWNARGASNLAELNRQLRARVMVRRTKAQVLKDLPPKTRQIIELDQPALARHNGSFSKLATAHQTLDTLFRRRNALRKAFAADTESRQETLERYRQQARTLAQEAKVAFFQMSEIRKETALAKVPQVMDLMADCLKNGKLILFCHHAEVVEAYTDALNTAFRKQAGRKGTPKTVAVVTGQTPNDQRQAEADRFQEDDNCQVFIGTIQAAGTGLTLTRASAVLFAELDWVPGNMNQAEDRAHRIGQLDHVLVYHTAIEGSIESLMIRRLIEKQMTIDAAIESTDQPRTAYHAPSSPHTPEEQAFADWLLTLADDSTAAERADATLREPESLILDDALAAQADDIAAAQQGFDAEMVLLAAEADYPDDLPMTHPHP